jgi:hypothetical protein
MFFNVFRRLFGQFQEGQIVRGVFTYDATANTYTATSASWNGGSGKTIKVTRSADGKATVSFPKCRNVEVLACRVDNGTPGTFGNIRQVELPPMTDSIANAGSFAIAQYKDDGTSGVPALAEMADGATLTIVLYLGA